ncbi:MAG: F0F1 ATP synthase subunit B [Sediminibacterium sp.]
MNLLTPDPGLLIWTLLAFLMVFYILKSMAWPAIIKGLKEREQNIEEAIATAERVKGEMAALQSENEQLMARAREERSQLLKDTREQTQKMISEAKDKAKAEYDRIVAEAQQAITQQKNAALTEVKNQVGSLVIEVSEKVLRRELGDRSQQEKYINQLAEELKLS